MDKNRLRITRLGKQQSSLEKDPLENAFVKRQDDLKFYFCLYKLEDDFTDGFYFGLLQLHPDYPFYAPKLFIYTPNGRYEQNVPICTSFTNYHQESWTSAWNVRTLIQATISFMYANEPSYGCRADSSQMRKKYARKSLSWNLQKDLFRQIFGETINSKLTEMVKSGIHIYSSELMAELKKLGLESMNRNNIKQVIQEPQKIIYKHKINDKKRLNKEQLNRPLLQQPQNQLQLGHIDLKNNVQLQRQNGRLNDQKNRKNRQKTNKIIKIIGIVAIVGFIGFFVYYNWPKPEAQVSASQINLNTNQKFGFFFNFISQIPQNFKSIFSSFKLNQTQKVIANNN